MSACPKQQSLSCTHTIPKQHTADHRSLQQVRALLGQTELAMSSARQQKTLAELDVRATAQSRSTMQLSGPGGSPNVSALHHLPAALPSLSQPARTEGLRHQAMSTQAQKCIWQQGELTCRAKPPPQPLTSPAMLPALCSKPILDSEDIQQPVLRPTCLQRCLICCNQRVLGIEYWPCLPRGTLLIIAWVGLNAPKHEQSLGKECPSVGKLGVILPAPLPCCYQGLSCAPCKHSDAF